MAVRYAPVLRAFAKEYEIDVIQLVTHWAGEMEPGADAGVLRRFDTITRRRTRPSLARRIAMRARTVWYPRPPHAVFSLDRRQVAEKLKHLMEGRHYDCGLWVCPDLADLAAPILRKHCDRIVYDAIDSLTSVESKKSSGTPLAKWDLSWLRRWEQHVSRLFDTACYISRSDIALITSDDPELAKEIMHLPNGVMHDDFNSEVATVDGIAPNDFVVGFLGHMAYGPNIQAALRLGKIYPGLRSEIPNVKLLIIGRSPAEPVRALLNTPGIVVTGTVDNIWPYINRANVFVFPMETGAGQQNKVLEAMFAKRPVVATSIANNGVGAIAGEEILLGETDEKLCQHIIALWRDPGFATHIGARGREFVEKTYSWDAILPDFFRILSTRAMRAKSSDQAG